MSRTGETPTEIINRERQEIVSDIIENMKKDGLRWSDNLLVHLNSINPTTGTVYRGANRLRLAAASRKENYSDNRWCTFAQIKENGWHLKKGSKGVHIEKWKAFKVTKKTREDDISDTDKTLEETPKSSELGIIYKPVGYWTVFNASQIEGIPARNLPIRRSIDELTHVANDLIRSSRCPVQESQGHIGSPAYSPARDTIYVPSRTFFEKDEAFIRVLAHEMVHSTGHPTALNRNILNAFGSPLYAQEELTAELGALFVCSDLNIASQQLSGEYYNNHVAYLKSWLNALEGDPNYLFKAASQADKASNFLEERYTATTKAGKEIDSIERNQERAVSKDEMQAHKGITLHNRVPRLREMGEQVRRTAEHLAHTPYDQRTPTIQQSKGV